MKGQGKSKNKIICLPIIPICLFFFRLRAEKIGASFKVSNRISGGTKVEIAVPGYLALQAAKN